MEKTRNSDTAAINVLLNNTGNKLFFRNTDIATHDHLQKLIPSPYLPGRPHLLHVRPVSTLVAGECYVLFSNGEWGKRQVELGLAAEPVDEPQARRS